MKLRISLAALALLLAAVSAPAAPGASPSAAPATRPSTHPHTFTNPVIRQDAADPWVLRHDGFYYFTATLDPEHAIWIWKSRTLTGLDSGEKVKIWTAPPSGPESHQIWAPELHFLQGKFYVYFTACDGQDRHHRQYVLESSDPLGPYVDRGRVDPDLDSFAIDGTVLALPDGRLFWLYSDGSLHIAPMLSPTRVDTSRRVTLASARCPWERHWLEAPEALLHDGRVFLAYSAGHSGTPHYSLGLLTLTGPDPLNPHDWSRSPVPVFAPYFGPDGALYTVGHNSFTTSPDGRENWILYHAKDWTGDHDEGFAGRKARLQPFSWNKDGTPHFGHPIPSGVPIPVPSGE